MGRQASQACDGMECGIAVEAVVYLEAIDKVFVGGSFVKIDAGLFRERERLAAEGEKSCKEDYKERDSGDEDDFEPFLYLLFHIFN